MDNIRCSESLIDGILSVINPSLYGHLEAALTDIRHNPHPTISRDVGARWPSVYTGISIMSNRITPPHRDAACYLQDYDLLVSAGNHRKAKLVIHDTGHAFAYSPGTVVALCGSILTHEVPTWSEGERLCIAHFSKFKVLNKLGYHMREFVNLDNYCL